MGAFLSAELLYVLQGIVCCLGQHVAATGIAVVEQGVEQRQRRIHAAATLRQRQWRMFVVEEAGQCLLGVLQRLRHAVATTAQADRQGVEEHAQHAVHAGTGMHAAEQQGGEHGLVATTATRQQQRVGQMEHTGGADAMLARLGAHGLCQCGCQGAMHLVDAGLLGHRRQHAERRGGSVDIGQHLTEERLMRLRGHAGPCVRDEVAERQGRRQLVLLSGQMDPHLFDQQFQGGVVHHQVMVLQAEQPASVCGVVGQMGVDEGRLLQDERGFGRMQPGLHVRGHVGSGGHMHIPAQCRLSPDHLHGSGQAIPDEAGAQDVVAGDDLIERIEEAIELFARGEAEQGRMQIGVGVWISQVMEQQAFLQWRQWIDVLHVGRATFDAGDHAVDLCLGQCEQRQQIGGDAGAVRADTVGWHHDAGERVQVIGQPGDGGAGEQLAHVELPVVPAQAFDQFDREQRMPAEGEEVVVTPDLLDVEQVAPQRGQDVLAFAAWRGIDSVLQCLGVWRRQRAAVELAVDGERQRIQPDIGGWHHVFG